MIQQKASYCQWGSRPNTTWPIIQWHIFNPFLPIMQDARSSSVVARGWCRKYGYCRLSRKRREYIKFDAWIPGLASSWTIQKPVLGTHLVAKPARTIVVPSDIYLKDRRSLLTCRSRIRLFAVLISTFASMFNSEWLRLLIPKGFYAACMLGLYRDFLVIYASAWQCLGP